MVSWNRGPASGHAFGSEELGRFSDVEEVDRVAEIEDRGVVPHRVGVEVLGGRRSPTNSGRAPRFCRGCSFGSVMNSSSQ
jgi:hypothetical protein